MLLKDKEAFQSSRLVRQLRPGKKIVYKELSDDTLKYNLINVLMGVYIQKVVGQFERRRNCCQQVH